jgi:hypothetical protein
MGREHRLPVTHATIHASLWNLPRSFTAVAVLRRTRLETGMIDQVQRGLKRADDWVNRVTVAPVLLVI